MKHIRVIRKRKDKAFVAGKNGFFAYFVSHPPFCLFSFYLQTLVRGVLTAAGCFFHIFSVELDLFRNGCFLKVAVVKFLFPLPPRYGEMMAVVVF